MILYELISILSELYTIYSFSYWKELLPFFWFYIANLSKLFTRLFQYLYQSSYSFFHSYHIFLCHHFFLSITDCFIIFKLHTRKNDILDVWFLHEVVVLRSKVWNRPCNLISVLVNRYLTSLLPYLSMYLKMMWNGITSRFLFMLIMKSLSGSRCPDTTRDLILIQLILFWLNLNSFVANLWNSLFDDASFVLSIHSRHISSIFFTSSINCVYFILRSLLWSRLWVFQVVVNHFHFVFSEQRGFFVFHGIR